MSLYLADYTVLKDGPVDLDNGKEVAYALTFPAGLVNHDGRSCPVISFRAVGGAWSEGTVRVSVDDDGDIHNVLSNAKVPPGQTIEYKEVVGTQVVNGTGDNSVRFRHIAGGQVTISDVVVWFQRRVDAEPG